MKTFRFKLADFDGGPAAVEVQAESLAQAKEKYSRLVAFYLVRGAPTVEAVEEVPAHDQGGCET